MSQPPTPQDNAISQLTHNPEKYRDYLLQMMVTNKASDMYLTFGESPCLRIHGSVHRITQIPVFTDDQLEHLALSLMDERQKKQFVEERDLDLGYSSNGGRYRVNVSHQRRHVLIVIRLLCSKIMTLDELGLPQIFKQIVRRHNGIILMAGATGSGKSTTLAAMIEEINISYPKHIITIEDPVEYIFTPKKSVVEQKELGTDIQSFSRGLKSALRQKPDVILFGEMRDLESIQNAITLAETGHLVLSTIHSQSAAQTISKIIDIFPPEQQNQIRIQLADSLSAVIYQRLLKKMDGTGMVPAQEIMLNNSAIKNLIRENKTNQIVNIIQTHRQEGMQALEDQLVQLAQQGIVAPQDALDAANDKKHVLRGLKAGAGN